MATVERVWYFSSSIISIETEHPLLDELCVVSGTRVRSEILGEGVIVGVGLPPHSYGAPKGKKEVLWCTFDKCDSEKVLSCDNTPRLVVL